MLSPRLIVAGLVLAAALATSWQLGARGVRGEWAAADLQRERAAQVLEAQARRQAAMAADRYEAQAQRLRAQAVTALPEVRHALQHPIPCLGAASTPLADLRIPAAVLDGLRRAGTDPALD